MASRRCAPCGSPLVSTAMPRAVHNLTTPATKVSRPESHADSAGTIKSHPVNPVVKRFEQDFGCRQIAVHAPATAEDQFETVFAVGRMSSCHGVSSGIAGNRHEFPGRERWRPMLAP